ncbi:hypothetical protein KQI68_07140 [Peptoniphilus sp. MSJ-1]|uniref:LAGLIDADG endonuclease n=1 Tax=Peptoniphilus ovalis TaxID=2841503 RepID=A0ABS6FJJ4_9FIRM|nr:hypothetical protein [Peptoniphilus ovalis]MBU5669613.1 hypothetical protein [Peptoniphilus ovalis]
MEKFKESLKCTSNITKKVTKNKYVSYRMVFNSPRISNRLAELNCVQAKSLIYEPPKLQNTKLERHMIRGFYDADGSLCMSDVVNENTGYFQLSITLVGTKATLDFVKNHFSENLPNVVFHKNYGEKGKSYYLRATGIENVLNICSYLYKNANYFLERKHDIFIQALNAPYVSDNIRVGSNIGKDCDVDTEITK